MLAECNNNSLARIKLQEGPIPPELFSRCRQAVAGVHFSFHFLVPFSGSHNQKCQTFSDQAKQKHFTVSHSNLSSSSSISFCTHLPPPSGTDLTGDLLARNSPPFGHPPFLNPNSTVCRWLLTPPSTLPNRISLAVRSTALRRLAR